MLHLAFKVLISVRAKLFFSFMAMTVLLALLGGYAVLSVNQAGSVVKDTFDRPLMAITYARAASQTFAEAELAVLSRSLGEAGSERPDMLLDTLRADLDIARERSISERAGPFFIQADEGIARFATLLTNAPDLESAALRTELRVVGENVKNALDIIVELQTNESFRARESSLATMKRVAIYTLAALGVALFLTLILSSWMAVTIVKPLNAAAVAARKISAGQLDVLIPKGGDDETGVLLKTMGLMQDNIRARVANEASLRTIAQDRLRHSLENSKDAILLTDHDNKIIVANRRVLEIFPTLTRYKTVQSQMFSNLFDAQGLPLGADCHLDAGEIAFPDGRWVRVNASATQEGGHLFIWTDITAQKREAENLLHAKRAAEAADQAKTIFLAAMSHELRTPLNAVIGFSEILVDENKGPTGNPDTAEMAAHINQSGAHLLNIVMDVLDVANGRDPDEVGEDFTEVDLRQICDFALKTFQSEAAAKQVRSTENLGQADLRVSGDASRLRQLLLNLIGNAVKFNKTGGRIAVTGSQKDGWVLLDISDTGIGIDNAQIKHVFEPFKQVESGRSRSYEGAGLGLTIARKIAREHGGQLHMRSVLGKGTTVRLVIPALVPSAQSRPTSNHSEAA